MHRSYLKCEAYVDNLIAVNSGMKSEETGKPTAETVIMATPATRSILNHFKHAKHGIFVESYQ